MRDFAVYKSSQPTAYGLIKSICFTGINLFYSANVCRCFPGWAAIAPPVFFLFSTFNDQVVFHSTKLTITSVIKRLKFPNKTVTSTSQIPTFLLCKIEANYIYLFSQAQPQSTQQRHPTAWIIGRIFTGNQKCLYSLPSKLFSLLFLSINHRIWEEIALPHPCDNQDKSHFFYLNFEE
ncbi:hypothetical protein NIES2119_31780 [[Phormidium ambiguum] IAM M-71]|uniref:Uncharacterized protein n=1 Tax=[Phormidium ambiguum] IAM M-71 TaxID=454136 RepID=A0A1U7I1S5_9CYAN|nr:hypothetical protein NIES2119_31780 [Phormidium ambiguum IAM M-71]